MTAAVKANTSRMSKLFGEMVDVGATRTPAHAPTKPASAQPIVSVRLTRTPDSRATSGLKAVARIARPSDVLVNSRVSPTTRSAANPITTRS